MEVFFVGKESAAVSFSCPLHHINEDARNTGVLTVYPGKVAEGMFERFFEQAAQGVVKALTLEWQCPKCEGINFRILTRAQRAGGDYHTRCRYCRTKFHVSFPAPQRPVEGEDAFMDRISLEDFSDEEITDMIRDFAEIASLRADRAPPGLIGEKEKALEAKIAFAKRRRR
jgi:hypothetical protein